MQVLSGNQAQVSFSGTVEVSGQPYTGPMNFEIIENGNSFPVDPAIGVSTTAVQATISPVDQQRLILNKLTEGVTFVVRATYPGQASGCSVLSAQRELQFAASDVFVSPMCVSVTA